MHSHSVRYHVQTYDKGWFGLLAVVALAALLALAWDPGYVGYDGLYSLMWGEDLVHLRDLRDYGELPSPTSHPLAIAAGAALSALGENGALCGYSALALVSLAALAWCAFLAAARLFSVAAGVAALALVLTRSFFLDQALLGSQDVPFAALLVGALAVEARRQRAGVPVLGLLALAGLLRPEAWLISGAYAVWLLVTGERGRRAAALIALALAGPVLWLGGDLAIEGDPLASLSVTQGYAERQTAGAEDEPDGLLEAVRELPSLLGTPLQGSVLLAASAGFVLCALFLRRRSGALLAAFAVSVGALLAASAVGVALLKRYFVGPAGLALVLAAAAGFGWRRAEGNARRVWLAAGAAVAALVLATSPGELRSLSRQADEGTQGRHAQSDLGDLLAGDEWRELHARCPGVSAARYRLRTQLAYRTEVAPTSIALPRSADLRAGRVRGLLVTPAPGARFFVRPVGLRLAARNRSWALWASCS